MLIAAFCFFLSLQGIKTRVNDLQEVTKSNTFETIELQVLTIGDICSLIF